MIVRNLYAIEWLTAHKDTTAAEFKKIYEGLD